MLTIINITLDSYNILIGIIFFIAVIFRHYISDKVQSWFKYLVLLNTIMAATDILTMICEGDSHPINFIILPIAMFIFYLMAFSLIVATCVELMLLIDLEKYRKSVYRVIIFASAVFLIFLILTPFTNLLYSIDANNHYTRGKYLFVTIILEVIIYGAFIIYIIKNRKEIDSTTLVIIFWFLIFPQIMQILQLVSNGMSLSSTGFSLSFILMYIVSKQKLEESLDYKEVELDEKENELVNKVSEAQRTKLEVIKMQNHTIESLSNLVENRDEDTGEHVRRTRAYVELIAVQLMKNNLYPEILTPRYVRFLKRAAPMHDIGKIVVPDAVLKKPGRLTEDEFELMKRHAAEGGRIVHEILDGYEDPEYIQMTADIATHHHEKWDGSGYPSHLKGDEIPLCARIMALADVFDALVSPRIYKSPMTYEEAYSIIEEGIGIHFDPIVAREFLNIKEKTAAVNESFKVID